MHITNKYAPVDDINRFTKVTFSASMVSGDLRLTLNEDRTYFDGISLYTYKTQSTSAGLINECLANSLDVMFKKTVQGSGSLSPAYGNIALIGSSALPDGVSIGGGGGGTQTCKHTYYINGVEMMSFEGSCP